MDDLARYLGLEQRLLQRLSTRVEPFDHGVAYFDDEYPDRYDSNFLMVDRVAAGTTAADLIVAADRILGGAGLGHREVVVCDDNTGRAMAEGFAAAGFVVDQNAVMVHRHAPDRQRGIAATEVDFDEARPFIREVYRRRPDMGGEALADSFASQHGKAGREIGARFFVAHIAGKAASCCELYINDRDAQIESVDTLEEFRNRGAATAVVLAALNAAKASGAQRVFILADDVDWPKELYAKLGFEKIGHTWLFLLHPPDQQDPT